MSEYDDFLNLADSLAKEFIRVAGETFPQLSPLDLMRAAGDVRSGAHNASMIVLHRLRQGQNLTSSEVE